VILPAIRATLQDLPLGQSSFISSFEKQSHASADRRGRSGQKPDIMLTMKHHEKNYELLYVECSRLFCSDQKDQDDEVKLWRECNDGLYWVHKGCKPDKNQFGVVGLQVAGRTMRLTTLIRDMSDIDRYYHLYESEVPVQQSDSLVVIEFIKTLLILRNLLIVNMSLLYNSSLSRSARLVKESSTVSSPDPIQ